MVRMKVNLFSWLDIREVFHVMLHNWIWAMTNNAHLYVSLDLTPMHMAYGPKGPMKF